MHDNAWKLAEEQIARCATIFVYLYVMNFRHKDPLYIYHNVYVKHKMSTRK